MPWRATRDGVVLALRVTPNARMEAIGGIEVLADGAAVLAVKVRAVPESGKANAAVIALLARVLGLPRSTIAVVAGATGRRKSLALAGDPSALLAALERAFSSLP